MGELHEGPAIFEDPAAHAVELFPQDGPASIKLPDPFPDPLPALPPLLLFFQDEQDVRRIHRGRTSQTVVTI